MASLVVANSDRDLLSMIVFPTAFAVAYTRIEEGNVYKIDYSLSKDEDLIFQEVITA